MVWKLKADVLFKNKSGAGDIGQMLPCEEKALGLGPQHCIKWMR